MAGRTTLTADLALRLYKNENAAGFAETWISLFLNGFEPSADLPTGQGTEWGPARTRVFPDSGSGSPYWGDPEDETTRVRVMRNVGSIQWLSITLTTSPSTVSAFGIYDSETGGNLLTWGTLDDNKVTTDGQDFVLATGIVQIKED